MTTPYRGQAPPPDTPALDFLRKVQVWQQAPGGTAGLAVAMPDGDEQMLSRILADASTPALFSASSLEQRARFWLIGYREMNPPLTPAQSAELDDVISRSAALPHAQLRPRSYRMAVIPSRYRLAVAAGALVLAGTAAVAGLEVSSGSQPVPAAVPVVAQQPGQQQQVPAGATQLEQFEADWGPFTQLPADPLHPQTGAPALILLRDGGYYLTGYDLPAGDRSWTPDLSGSTTSVTMHGTYALVTDADGNVWVVGTDQPFVLAGNPGTVFRVSPDGTVQSIPTAHASAVRTRH